MPWDLQGPHGAAPSPCSSTKGMGTAHPHPEQTINLPHPGHTQAGHLFPVYCETQDRTRLTISVPPFLSRCPPRCQAQLGLHIFLQPPLTSTITSQSASSPKAGLGFWEVSKAPPSPHLYLIPVSGNADHTNWQCKRRLPATDRLHSDQSH